MKEACCYCGSSDKELRPYGPNGSPLCFPCMKSDKTIEASAREIFIGQLNAAAVAGQGHVVLGETTEPRPLQNRRPI